MEKKEKYVKGGTYELLFFDNLAEMISQLSLKIHVAFHWVEMFSFFQTLTFYFLQHKWILYYFAPQVLTTAEFNFK